MSTKQSTLRDDANLVVQTCTLDYLCFDDDVYEASYVRWQVGLLAW